MMPGTATTQQTMTIIVDTREQTPFKFDAILRHEIPFAVERRTLKTGDYSIDMSLTAPMTDQIVIERKSLQDLYGSVGKGRIRFEDEFKRMAEFGRAVLIIEAPWEQILKPNDYLRYPTQMNPRSVANTLIAWMLRYDVHILPCINRRFAEQMTYRILEKWFKDHA